MLCSGRGSWWDRCCPLLSAGLVIPSSHSPSPADKSLPPSLPLFSPPFLLCPLPPASPKQTPFWQGGGHGNKQLSWPRQAWQEPGVLAQPSTNLGQPHVSWSWAPHAQGRRGGRSSWPSTIPSPFSCLLGTSAGSSISARHPGSWVPSEFVPMMAVPVLQGVAHEGGCSSKGFLLEAPREVLGEIGCTWRAAGPNWSTGQGQ